ncbi:DUF3955 domain-containing protein [Burkholderia pseudomallei]|uniref:DUF3955 domain-containing protein n=1 Tax=Burkholderia pseudomallei TaxID=28450 RepID=UPI00017365B8|nr:DUF3955 domain-containing protein [Burkholderia pseudomallei]AIP03429.1 hypothetical protein DP51_590 [Burkholderia pseudomallei]AIV49371.1 hypothetical protein X988_1251 [Burkholderia pseudomallei TSV 48]AUG21473.1 DUF3955 domain-containing protein [Burkholderia pseudomallei]EDU07730.1 conserved hypothetical protein [Burkholderia pseudomallei 1655]EMP76883.1 hypothetical protein D512_08243 [Burkholderia pseudomallei MSHR1043]
MKLVFPACLAFVAGIVCFARFAASGSDVDAFGRLHEPFGLLPLGWALTLLGGTGLLIGAAQAVVRRSARRR